MLDNNPTMFINSAAKEYRCVNDVFMTLEPNGTLPVTTIQSGGWDDGSVHYDLIFDGITNATVFK